MDECKSRQEEASSVTTGRTSEDGGGMAAVKRSETEIWWIDKSRL